MAKLEFRPYHRQFKHVLQTSHGEWRFREGIILRLSDQTGKVGFGEVAPISWFGSESFEQALNFCDQLPVEITAETIFSIPLTRPACQFGFESAWEAIKFGLPILNSGFTVSSKQAKSSMGKRLHSTQNLNEISLSGLLPTGNAALQAWSALWNQGYRTFKWKIGVTSMQAEVKILNQLAQALPAAARLRLDANGGLSYQEANEWLKICDRVGIEFLEQPLPVAEFDAMLELSSRYATPLALDESVATLNQLQDCYQKGWRGLFMIKPAIAGSPTQLRQFCRAHDVDVLFSSVFETAIARRAGLQLAAELSRGNRAVGFGVNHWFGEDDCLDQPTLLDFEHLWNNL